MWCLSIDRKLTMALGALLLAIRRSIRLDGDLFDLKMAEMEQTLAHRVLHSDVVALLVGRIQNACCL